VKAGDAIVDLIGGGLNRSGCVAGRSVGCVREESVLPNRVEDFNCPNF
jgi:hypothetical protein